MTMRLQLIAGFVVVGFGPPALAQGGPGTDRHGDALPQGAFARMGTLSFRGVAPPLAFSPDGKALACMPTTWGLERAILWEVATGKPLRRLRLERFRGPTALSFSSDGKWLALSDYSDGGIVVDVVTGEKVSSFRGDHGVFSGDG